MCCPTHTVRSSAILYIQTVTVNQPPVGVRPGLVADRPTLARLVFESR